MSVSSAGQGLRPGVCTSSTRPSSPYTGQIIYETDTGYLRVWDGSAWDYLSQSQNDTTNFPVNTISAVLSTPTSADINGSAAYWRSNVISCNTSATHSLGLGYGIGSPFIFNKSVVISEIGCRVSGGTGALVKLLIYSCPANSGVPTTMVYESSNISVAGATTTYSVTGLSITLPAGMYWIFVFSTTSNAVSVQALASNQSMGVTPHSSMVQITQPTSGGSWLLDSIGSPTPPATLSFTTTANMQGSPFASIGIRRSS